MDSGRDPDAAPFWRVYRDEWTTAYVSDSDGETGKQECEQRRPADDDREWRTVPWSDDEPGRWPWSLQVYRPVMKGEFRGEDAAALLASALGGVAVREDSDTDRAFQKRTSW